MKTIEHLHFVIFLSIPHLTKYLCGVCLFSPDIGLYINVQARRFGNALLIYELWLSFSLGSHLSSDKLMHVHYDK